MTVAIENNEKVLFLLNKFTGVAPYSHEFQLEGLDPQLLSGFVGAMGSFLGEFAGSEESTWTTAYGSDSTFVVEVGKWVVGVLAVSRETSRLRSQLRSIVREFEQTFGALKDADGLEGHVFEQFDQFVRRVFTEELITPKSLVFRKRKRHEDLFVSLDSPMQSYQLTKILLYLKDGKSVAEISRSTEIPEKAVEQLLSHAYWQNIVHVRYVPSEGDILQLSEKALGRIFNPENPLCISHVARVLLASLDGRTTLGSLFPKAIEAEREGVLREIGKLISTGYVTRIPIEQKLLLVDECVLTRFGRACSDLLDGKRIVECIKKEIAESAAQHPWLLRVNVGDDLRIICDLGDIMSPAEFNWASDALEHLQTKVFDRISAKLTRRNAKDILLYARKHCQEDWMPELCEGLF